MLREISQTPDQDLPLAHLQDHLRLGRGFELPSDQEALLRSYLRASLATIETRIGKAIFTRDFELEIRTWRGLNQHPLPIAPISHIQQITLHHTNHQEDIAPQTYRLEPDRHRPKLVATVGSLPYITSQSRVVIEFQAGFGRDWADIPIDLQHAVLQLAAQFYEHRHDDVGVSQGLPPSIDRLIAPWRLIRLFGGNGQ